MAVIVVGVALAVLAAVGFASAIGARGWSGDGELTAKCVLLSGAVIGGILSGTALLWARFESSAARLSVISALAVRGLGLVEVWQLLRILAGFLLLVPIVLGSIFYWMYSIGDAPEPILQIRSRAARLEVRDGASSVHATDVVEVLVLRRQPARNDSVVHDSALGDTEVTQDAALDAVRRLPAVREADPPWSVSIDDGPWNASPGRFWALRITRDVPLSPEKGKRMAGTNLFRFEPADLSIPRLPGGVDEYVLESPPGVVVVHNLEAEGVLSLNEEGEAIEVVRTTEAPLPGQPVLVRCSLYPKLPVAGLQRFWLSYGSGAAVVLVGVAMFVAFLGLSLAGFVGNSFLGPMMRRWLARWSVIQLPAVPAGASHEERDGAAVKALILLFSAEELRGLARAMSAPEVEQELPTPPTPPAKLAEDLFQVSRRTGRSGDLLRLAQAARPLAAPSLSPLFSVEGASG